MGQAITTSPHPVLLFTMAVRCIKEIVNIYNLQDVLSAADRYEYQLSRKVEGSLQAAENLTADQQKALVIMARDMNLHFFAPIDDEVKAIARKPHIGLEIVHSGKLDKVLHCYIKFVLRLNWLNRTRYSESWCLLVFKLLITLLQVLVIMVLLVFLPFTSFVSLTCLESGCCSTQEQDAASDASPSREASNFPPVGDTSGSMISLPPLTINSEAATGAASSFQTRMDSQEASQATVLPVATCTSPYQESQSDIGTPSRAAREPLLGHGGQ